jgi:drug/metabolite transporter (DMT)-like permease
MALLTSLFWAGNTYTIRRGSGELPFLVINSLRYLIGLAVLAAGLVLLPRSSPGLRSGSPGRTGSSLSPRFLLTILIEAFGGSSIFVYGLAHSDLSVAAPLSSLAPLFSVPIGLALHTETLNARRVAAIVITVAGVVLLVR